ncbi:MAG: DUF1572 family protein [Fuerstiella sp.]
MRLIASACYGGALRQVSELREQFVGQFRAECIHLLNQSFSRITYCVMQLDAAQLWWQPAAGQNSVGALLRHLAGNLQQWAVDGVLDQPGFRDRNAEFHAEAVESAEVLLQRLEQVIERAREVLSALGDDDFVQTRSIQGFEVTVLGAIMHTVPHLVGHTHQIVTLTRMQLGANYQFHWDSAVSGGSVPL